MWSEEPETNENQPAEKTWMQFGTELNKAWHKQVVTKLHLPVPLICFLFSIASQTEYWTIMTRGPSQMYLAFIFPSIIQYSTPARTCTHERKIWTMSIQPLDVAWKSTNLESEEHALVYNDQELVLMDISPYTCALYFT